MCAFCFKAKKIDFRDSSEAILTGLQIRTCLQNFIVCVYVIKFRINNFCVKNCPSVGAASATTEARSHAKIFRMDQEPF